MPAANSGNAAPTGVTLIPVENLRANPHQPRRHIDEEGIEALARSIAENGLLQPIVVRRDSNRAGAFEIVAGERRWRATQRVGLSRIPAIVLNLSDVQALELGLLENLQREDLTALELAQGYQRLMSDFGHSQESLARKLAKSRSHIANTLRLLNLPRGTQEMLQDGRLSAGHGRALLTAERPEALAGLVVARGLNVRETEDLVRRRNAPHAGPENAGKAPATELAVDPVLSTLLGHKVTVSYRGQRGVLTIHFDGLEGLSRLVKRLKAALTGLAGTTEVAAESGVEADPSGNEFPGAVHAQLRKLGTEYDQSRPPQWNEKAYGPMPEQRLEKPSADTASDDPKKAAAPVRASRS
jgi:ParB family chromosome partitioning protein